MGSHEAHFSRPLRPGVPQILDRAGPCAQMLEIFKACPKLWENLADTIRLGPN
jgi:hypothetical protein